MMLICPLISSAQYLNHNIPAPVEVFKFQNGALPDAAYSGLNTTWISSTAATTNLSSDSLMTVGNNAIGPTGMIGVKVDFEGTIPDSFAITKAWIRIILDSEGAAQNEVCFLHVSQPYIDWTMAGVDWNTYDGTNTWGTSGLGDVLGTFANLFGVAAAQNFRMPINSYNHLWTTRATIDGIVLAMGSDSLALAHADFQDNADIASIGTDITPIEPQNGATFSKFWIDINVTTWIQRLHTSNKEDYGAFIRMDNYANDTLALYLVLKSEDTLVQAWKPTLFVQGVWPSTLVNPGGTNSVSGSVSDQGLN
jgi:hypothetical protein